MGAKRLRFGLLVLPQLALACATARPPVEFSKSKAYRQISQSLRALLQRDLDSNGLSDVVAVVRVGPGFAPRQVRQWEEAGDAAWQLGCVGPVVEGEDLGVLTWAHIDNASRDLLLIIATEDNPEELVQNMALVDMLGDCTSVFSERVVLPKADTEVLAPGPVPGGVLAPPTGGVRLVDHPDMLTLQGASGEVKLLLGVRERRIAAEDARIAIAEAERHFLVRRRVSASWRPADGESLPTEELVDGRESTAFVARAGESGTLIVRTRNPQEPLLLLELGHGCEPGITDPLQLGGDDGAGSYLTGEPPSTDSVVRAAGRTQHTERGFLRDLVVMAKPADELTLQVGPAGADRCLREIKAYGWLPAAAITQAALGSGREWVIPGTSP